MNGKTILPVTQAGGEKMILSVEKLQTQAMRALLSWRGIASDPLPEFAEMVLGIQPSTQPDGLRAGGDLFIPLIYDRHSDEWALDTISSILGKSSEWCRWLMQQQSVQPKPRIGASRSPIRAAI